MGARLVKTLDRFQGLASRLLEEASALYRDRLVSVAVFGSVARGVPTPESDLDVLLVVDPLPAGRLRRVAEFELLEDRLADDLATMARAGVHAVVSPVIKTRDEVRRGSPVFLDMTIDVSILFDPDGFLRGYLDGLRDRMARLGSRRVALGGGYYWLLKPDLKPGEVFEL